MKLQQHQLHQDAEVLLIRYQGRGVWGSSPGAFFTSEHLTLDKSDPLSVTCLAGTVSSHLTNITLIWLGSNV